MQEPGSREATTAAESPDLDRLIQANYAAAFECGWREFRPQALERLCAWAGAAAAAWLTRGPSDLAGEYAVWPENIEVPQAAVAAIPLSPGRREQRMALPQQWQLGLSSSGYEVLALYVVHRDTAMSSVLCLVLPTVAAVEASALRRAVGYLAQAGTLSLSQFVQRDEWLQSLGRPSRGSAALVDAKGGIYVASRRFRELLRDQFGDVESSSLLPFRLPATVIEEGGGEFSIDTLHFRVAREGELFLIHARKPHPLDVLSPREQEIARALANGKTFKSVARDCDIAISTVANHASRIYRKLGIYRREELVRLLRTAATAQGMQARSA